MQKTLDLNPYDVFQLNKVYDIDKELLEERYLELQKTLHPDKFINSTDIERDISNSQTSFVNNAYELLENDISRVKILLKLKNYNMNDENASFKDTNILEEIMDLQNRCMSSSNTNETKKIKLSIESKIKDEKKISINLTKENYSEVHKSIVKLSYLEKININLN